MIFLDKIALGHRGGHFGDVAHLAGEVGGHEVHIVGQVLPRAGDAAHIGLTAELAFGAHFAGHAGHFGGERVQLVHHGVDGVLQLENFAAHVHGDLLGQVAGRDGGGHFGDVAHLAREVGGHGVHIVGQVLPGAGHAAHIGLAAEAPFGAHFAGHARHFGGEGVQLVHHGVDGVLQLQDFALHVHGDLLGQVAIGHRGGHGGDVAHLAGEVGGHGVHVVGQVLPGAGDAFHLGLAAELSFGAHFAGHAGHFGGERVQLVHHGVDGVLQLQDFALHVHGDLLGQVAVRHRGGHVGDVAHLAGEVGGHQVHVVGQVLPGAGDAAHIGLAAELSFGAHFAGHAGHFGGERVQLVHHGVDGVLEVENFAAHVHGDLLGQVAGGHRGGHFGDVAHLAGQVGGHQVHVVGQVLPGAGDAFHLGLTAELSFGAHFAGHAGHFRGEGVQLVHHGVDGVLQLQDFALHVHGDLLGQVALRHGGGHFGDVAHLAGEVGGHQVHVVGQSPSRCRRRRAHWPGRRAFLRCPLRGPRGSLRRRRSSAGPPWC